MVNFLAFCSSFRSLRISLFVIFFLSLICFFIFFGCQSNHTHAKKSDKKHGDLNFYNDGDLLAAYSLYDLKKRVKVYKVNYYDPFYKKEKKFYGFKLHDILDNAYGVIWRENKSDMRFVALDGYASISSVDLMREEGGFVVFQDRDFLDSWEPISRRQVSPFPYYLVWVGKEQNTKNGYPWPWQLADVKIIADPDKIYKKIANNIEKSSMAYKGFTLFKNRCLRCHAINTYGGKIGPDLNAPQGILSYRSEFMVKELIKHSSKYRYSKMPDHLDLTDEDLENLIRYFKQIDQTK